MKVTSSKSYDVGCRKNNLTQQPNLNVRAERGDVAFGSAKQGVTKVLDFVDKKGFFGEFLIVDTLSLIVPRIVIGLNRDKEKTGHLNYQAGLEEAGREVISGPSMFLIPMGIIELVKHLSPAAKIQRDILSELSASMDDVLKNTKDVSVLKDKDKLSRNISGTLFDRAFGDYELKNKKALKNKFVDLLNDPSAKIADFEKLVVEINNKNKSKTTLDSHMVIKSKNGSISANPLFKDFKHYSNDVVDKFAKHDFGKGTLESSKEAAKGFLEHIQKVRRTTRIGASVASYLAVGAFLLELPKLYLRSKISPAMASAKRARQEVSDGGGYENI